jgi:transcriptional regulator with XRE-family HTH domain
MSNDRTTERKTLRQWRDAAYLTQGELADKIGVTLTSISNWEIGTKQPRVKNLRALAAALSITPDQIILVHRDEEEAS